MTTKKPLATNSIKALLAATQQDEQLELCDERARGNKTAAEVDAALGTASPRLQRIRQMSEPLTVEQRDRLVAQLLRSAPSQPSLIAVPSGAVARNLPTRRTRTLGLSASGLALAASIALYVAGPLVGEQLPALALEVAEHNSAVLGAPTLVGPADNPVHPGSCLELRLRPERSYSTELQTAVWVVAKGADAAPQPVPWPVQLHRTEKGMLQLDACAPLPGAVGPGSWQIAVVYGRELPPAAAVWKTLAPPTAGTAAAKWQIAWKPLQVVAATP